MATFYQREPNFKEIAKRENNFNYSVASLGDIYRPYLTTKQQQRQYDILTEEEMISRGINAGRPNFSYKKYNNLNQPKDPNLKNVNINQVDLGKGMSQNIYLNQGKSPGKLKGHKIKSQRPTSAISTKKIKYNQDLDPAQKNRIMDVNYLHLTKLPESKKFSHVDKAFINPVQSTFSVKNIVDDNIKKHEKMMRPIVLYPDPVRIFNEQPDKILPGTLRRSQEDIEEFEKSNKAKRNMMIIGQGRNTAVTCRDNHVVFNKPAENRFRRKATSTRAARNTLLESEDFVKSLEDFFNSTDFKVPSKTNINDILENKAEKLEKSLDTFEKQICGKKKMKTDTSKYLYHDPFKNKKRKKGFGQTEIKPRGPKVYPEIDYEFRKKIQERLSRLQINLRQIFDNISILKKNKTKENVKKIQEQIKKARELTNYVRHLADDVNRGEEEFKNSFQRPKSTSPKKRKKNINQNMNMNSSFTNTSFNSNNMIPQNNASYYRTFNNPTHPTNNNNNNNNLNNLNNTMDQNMQSQSLNNTTYPNNQNNMNNTINNNFNNTNNSFNNTNNNNQNNNNNNAPSTSQISPNKSQQLENPLEYSSTSIGSNINPMNSFSSNVNNVSVAQQQNNQINNQNANNVNYNTLYQNQNNNNMAKSKTNIYMQSQNFNPIIEDPNEETNNNINNNSSTINNRLMNSTRTQNTNINQNNISNNNLNSNSLANTQRLPNQNLQNSTNTSNYFLQSKNSIKDMNNNQKTSKPKTTTKSKVTFNNNNNKSINKKPATSTNTLTESKMITVSLAEPSYFRNKPKNSQTFRGTTSISLVNPKKSDVLTQSHVINDIDQTINHVPMQAEEMKVNTHNYIEDERYSAFNVEFPVHYYYELTREHEPPKNKEWFIRPHHTETFVESNNAIPDDIMNTKYISYYAPASTEKKKTRQDILEELIMETRAHINELQEDMFKKSNLNSEGEKLYSKLEGLREEAKNSFIPGYRDAKEAKQKNIFDMLKDPNSGASYTEMFDQNEDIKQTNFAISSLGTMLSELRDKERNIINIKRKEEYERIRPPIDRWYELKGDNFLSEIIRNKMVLNSGPEYFEKIEELQNEELY